jgi:RNA polymerase sigma factor (sigma-70 family)
MSDGNARLIALLVRVSAGEQAALRSLYDLTSAKLFGVILRITAGDRAAAEEVLQDSYVKVWRKASLFDPGKASAITWLCTIARNAAIDWRRSNALLPQPLSQEDAASELADMSVDAQADMESRSMRHHILNCLGQLEPQQAQAVKTAFFDGLTHSELSAHMAVPLGTLKSWIRRAMSVLKDCIDDGR